MATILVAEDERDLNGLLKRHLEDEGHRVVQAFDGSAALLAVQQESPDLVILDWMLPKLDGLEVARRARALPRGVRTPIIMFTDREVERDARRAGVDAYLRKPRGVYSLARTAAVLLGRG